jgi:hypothetical protein
MVRVDDSLRPAFIVYLLSHNRPMAEALAPTRKNIEEEFARGFQGMTAEPSCSRSADFSSAIR